MTMQAYLQGAVAPRPIAFASTVDSEGCVNLSPFSFFNVFSANPPVLVFSPARRGRDNTTKDTLENVLEVPEVSINIVNYSMVQQASLASTEYPRGVNEFVKSGLTPVPSARIRPPRVAQSPASFECMVKQVIPLGNQGAAGNLVITEVVLMHVSEDILDDQRRIDPRKLDAVARMGGDWYCRAGGEALFTVPKPLATRGIGVDQIPSSIRSSKVLTGNDLGMLGNVEQLPDAAEVAAVHLQSECSEALKTGTDAVHKLAQALLHKGNVSQAWALLLAHEH